MSNDDNPTDENAKTFEQQLQAYRAKLLNSSTTMQAEYDKTVIALSGGALGLSIGMLKDIFGRTNVTATGFLVAAWIFWAISLSSTLYSYYSSAEAFRQALKKLDERTIYLDQRSRWDSATAILNAASGFLFLAGIVSLIAFLNRTRRT